MYEYQGEGCWGLSCLTAALPQLLDQLGAEPLKHIVSKYTAGIQDARSFIAQMAKLQAEQGDKIQWMLTS